MIHFAQVQRGQPWTVQVTNGRRKALRIEVSETEGNPLKAGLLQLSHRLRIMRSGGMLCREERPIRC
jgi:hypothetical protein